MNGNITNKLLVVLALVVSALALAGWTGTGNGRGGQVAARPTCSDVYRGRTWALYGATSATSDLFQVCVFSTAGGGTYVYKNYNTTTAVP